MKLKTLSLFAGIALVSLAALTGCGSNNNATVATGQCAVGQVHTQYGCVQQAPANQCGSAGIFGLYNGQCVQATAPTGVAQGGSCAVGQIQTQQYGCQPQAVQGQCPQNGQTYAWYLNQCVIGTPSYNNGGYNNNQCGVGVVYTQYGCLPQGQCPANYGFIANSCIPAIQQGGYGSYGNGYGNGYNGYGNGYGAGAGFYFGYGAGNGYSNQGCPYGYYYYMGQCVR